MADIVISEFMDESIIETSFKGQDYLFDPTLVDKHEQLFEAVTNARALIVRNRTQVRGKLLASASQLKVVGRLGVGLDNIDLDACKKRGITVCPASGANDLSVAEYVITAALMLLRRTWFATNSVIVGDWPRMDLIGREISGKRMGLIGYGAIAAETAMKARALGMHICACDPYLPASDSRWSGTEKMDFQTLLRTSDIVSLHVPLTNETRHMMNKATIAEMRHDAILINAARGGIVDESALVDALNSQVLGGAALDVFETEPVNETTGRLFKDVQNLVLTPHIAGVTKESNIRVSRLTVDNVLKHLD